jgi:hypothetical protein
MIRRNLITNATLPDEEYNRKLIDKPGVPLRSEFLL